MGRDKYPRQSLGTLHARIKESRVLLVGAGGIGCELLKNLVLTGFGEIHIVDLDTIDLSNLNRQFLFRQEHIKKSKALVAKDTARHFNPNVKLEAHHANIKDPTFSLEWFGSFTLVFNALDNLDARRHVNKMCLAADVPLIESGTTGFNGQVQVIKKGKTECYDCNTKETPKSFPVCTIRSTPSQPMHCIVWAKSYLFTEIFGTSEDDAPELDHSEDSDNANEIENLRLEAQALNIIRASMGSELFPQKVFEKVFEKDVHRLRSMSDMWKSRRPPEPLRYDELGKKASMLDTSIASQDQRKWTLEENVKVFADSLQRLSIRLQQAQAQSAKGDPPAILTFDKDDTDALDFVAASANLRSIVFGIETHSKFDIKQMAGNIIPAIATTNAMVAGLCVLQAFKVMRDNLDGARMVFLAKSAERTITAEPLRPPNPECPVCSVAQSRLTVDTSRATLKDLVDGFLRGQLGYGEEFSVSIDEGVLYDPELDDNIDSPLRDMGVKNDTFLTVTDDEEESPRVNLVLTVMDKLLPEDSSPIVAPGKIDIPRRTALQPTNSEVVDFAVQSNGVAATNGIIEKRKRDADEAELDSIAEVQLPKRGKLMESRPSDEVVLLEEDGANGAIVIDDD
ncbi:MAG: E1 ubiquitin-activating protein uba2 [Caeruleum heppii]|nr:MAG: E1 ubiquitin-activating protein uba2 [Caeruleum heppii]